MAFHVKGAGETVRSRILRALLLTFIVLAVASASSAAQGPDGTTATTPRAPRTRVHGFPPVFTHPPTPISNVSRVRPLGNVNGTSHIMPVDHMYLRYPDGPTGGNDTIPLQAMGAGELVMVAKRIEEGFPVPDYSILIRHAAGVTSQYEHVHALADRVASHLESTGTGWVTINPQFEIIFLGQLGAPPPLPLAGGELVASTSSYSEYWDLGVIDAGARGVFANPSFRRYPTILDFADVLDLPLDHAPYPGQDTLNAGCFLSYMVPALRAEWFPLLESTPQSCGRADWDVESRLQGTWFNPLIDTLEPPPLFDNDAAAFSIVPHNLSPATEVQIAIAAGHPLAAIDPTGAFPQLRRTFVAAMDRSAGARVNPDPAAVSAATGAVCYDLRYATEAGERFNALVLLLSAPRELRIFYDPTPSASSRCPSTLAAGVTAWTATYVR